LVKEERLRANQAAEMRKRAVITMGGLLLGASTTNYFEFTVGRVYFALKNKAISNTPL